MPWFRHIAALAPRSKSSWTKYRPRCRRCPFRLISSTAVNLHRQRRRRIHSNRTTICSTAVAIMVEVVQVAAEVPHAHRNTGERHSDIITISCKVVILPAVIKGLEWTCWSQAPVAKRVPRNHPGHRHASRISSSCNSNSSKQLHRRTFSNITRHRIYITIRF